MTAACLTRLRSTAARTRSFSVAARSFPCVIANTEATCTHDMHHTIQAIDQCVASMHRGESRSISCSPADAYGEQGFPPRVPPNASLTYDIMLVDWRPTVCALCPQGPQCARYGSFLSSSLSQPSLGTHHRLSEYKRHCESRTRAQSNSRCAVSISIDLC